MREIARAINACGEAEYRDQAEENLKRAGDIAFVRRGVLRSVLIRCPCTCGETLVINLDPRAGKAWRLLEREGKLTLYPSIWREGGCESHFIVWADRIIWCDRFEFGNIEPPYDDRLEERVAAILDSVRFQTIEELAHALEEIPWAVGRVARRLVYHGIATTGRGEKRDSFRRRSKAEG